MKSLVFCALVSLVGAPTAALTADLKLDPVASLPRMFGNSVPESNELKIMGMAPKTDSIEVEGKEVQLSFSGQDPEPKLLDVSAFKPKIVASGDMIQTKGIYPGRGYFYIADTGKDRKHSEIGRIWRFDPKSGQLVKFYESDNLLTPKWIFYYTGATPSEDQLIVADLGDEPIPRNPGTGVGAKVISIPIREDGTAGPAKILHEGKPFRSPEGVTVIGKTVILSDWAAGSETTRPEVPDDPYLQGLVFALPLEGGPPRVLFSNQKWVTLIGACQFRDIHGDLFLRLIDIDGGRLETEEPTFPRSGLVKYLIAKVMSEEPLVLGELKEQKLYEDVPIVLPAGVLEAASGFKIRLKNGVLFLDGSTEKTFGSGTSRFTVRSPNTDDEVAFRASLLDSSGKEIKTHEVSVPKLQEGGAVPLNNKHAGSGREKFSHSEGVLSGSVDGTSRALFIFPPKGGTPAILWRGVPFHEPMGVQFAKDGSKVYVTDQAAGTDGKSVLFELTMPDENALSEMFDPKLQ
ncbi:hypothetical protein ACCT14_20520 [Rhizobium brockwellii]|uniref:hypothetical protein n=1 Tax=Rhizobium brockwellii TaxID=3019932 RepID=UPI003F998B43